MTKYKFAQSFKQTRRRQKRERYLKTESFVFVITDVRLPKRSGSTTAFLARNFNVKQDRQDEVGNTDGTNLFIFPDWYFGALNFSVANAAAKRRSKFAFDRSQ